MTTARRLLPVLLLLLVLPALVAACGEDEQDSFSVADAAASTRDADSARFRTSVEMSGLGLPQAVKVTGTGVTATAAPRMDATLDFGPLLRIAGAQGDGAVRVILDEADVYVDPPALPGLSLPGGAQWVTADLGRVLDAFGVDATGLGELMRLTPEQQLRALEAAQSIKRVGEEEIDGVQTTHYRGNVRMSDYIEGLPAERRDKVRQAIKQLNELPGGAGADFDAPMTTDLWVDGDDLVRRMTSASAVPAQQGQPAGRMKIAMELFDYGTDLEVKAPASDDVFDATETLVRGLRSLR